ncbi:MAG: enoyl-CoA hydratase/isomerase family protein [Pseudomonadota bacterium]|jgi:enoyl-CoA hydratase|nr:enoyl-CoA hydratase/isomerase family protein [Alphaproteobacteria bacterium]MEC7202242.1 enoyl-CoA hydratase/isomerase family protein [Pseudomonadota bacterium]MEC7302140.1 enoyl-CoA hydratase/isomerase family protein [Pseudomonadota bacterium]MEC7536455.1 enoyl-CoA hydratase/isomerase family protein [Pseudomonadota bacterium]MEC7648632.1 enoyl-CoA hydratase/isomerase family protein [Pseudomonadota bacterium]|tara:strand:+ start:1607 stop:2422 length:816 start_codon:yes stop_codon:yes gene_type:complete
MHEDVIKIERRGTIAILTFNRPKVLNAFNNNLMERTIETVKILNEDDDVRIIVVQGAGRAFSPGFDLKASAERRMESVQDWEQQMKLQFDFIMQFWHSPKPTIAAVHGYCIAGAFELALACDVTIAAENTRFGEPEVRFGTGIVAMLLPWVTGPKQAKELLLTGEDQLNAKDAFRMGIINRIVPDDAVLDRALEVAKSMATAAERSVRYTKRAINDTYATMGFNRALESALDTDVLLNAAYDPVKAEFARIRSEQGVKAAIAWRDARFREG